MLVGAWPSPGATLIFDVPCCFDFSEPANCVFHKIPLGQQQTLQSWEYLLAKQNQECEEDKE